MNPMRPDQNDELLIQRCLDDELTPEETRQLMARLNQVTDGWKILACGFISERTICRAVAGSDQSLRETKSAMSDLHAMKTAAADSLSEHSRKVSVARMSDGGAAGRTAVRDVTTGVARASVPWRSHPLTSLTLCAAIAFVTGLLIPDASIRNRSGFFGWRKESPVVADARQVGSGSISPDSPPVGKDRNSNSTSAFQVELHPDGTNQGKPMSIPLVRDREKLFEGLRQNQKRSHQMRQQYPGLAVQRSDNGLRAVLVPVDDEHNAIIFVDEQIFSQPAQ